MGNRPINRRPWKRKPWARRRASRWVELNCTGATDRCISEVVPIICYDPDPTVRQVREMWRGDIDAEYADDNTVLLERIVGSLNVGTLALPDAEGNFMLPNVRMGILAVEEVEDIATWQAPSLFIREDIEEYQWLWMYEFPSTAEVWVEPEPKGYRAAYHLDLDLRVRRKLGKKDSLVLLAERAGNFEAGTTAASYTYLLRGVFTTK